MNEAKFWKIIGLFDVKQTDSLAIMKNAIQVLSELEITEIESFTDILAEKLFVLDAEKYTQNLDKPISVDDFLYVRCFVVANGEAYYQEILQNPEKLEDSAFEPLLSLPDLAFEQKTNQEFLYITKVSYETYSNAEGWKEAGIISPLHALLND